MNTFEKPTRVWIDCPSKNYPEHKYNGKVGIALTEENGFARVYFCYGKVKSIRINPIFLQTNNSHTNIFKE